MIRMDRLLKVLAIAALIGFIGLWFLSIQYNAPKVKIEQELLGRISASYQKEPSIIRKRTEAYIEACTSLSNFEVYSCMVDLDSGFEIPPHVDSVIRTCIVRVCALRVAPNVTRMEIIIEE